MCGHHCPSKPDSNAINIPLHENQESRLHWDEGLGGWWGGGVIFSLHTSKVAVQVTVHNDPQQSLVLSAVYTSSKAIVVMWSLCYFLLFAYNVPSELKGVKGADLNECKERPKLT